MNILEHFDHAEKKQEKEHFINLIQVAMADGLIDQSESAMLHRFGRKMGFTDSEIDELIELSRKHSYNPPYEFQKRFEQAYDIVKMVLADGVIDKNEMRIANSYATKLGFSESEIPGLMVLLISGIRQGQDEEYLFEQYKKEKRLLKSKDVS
ncbi:MAG: hypothetical protein AB9846_08490 [Tenuifilaceae bacterium]